MVLRNRREFRGQFYPDFITWLQEVELNSRQLSFLNPDRGIANSGSALYIVDPVYSELNRALVFWMHSSKRLPSSPSRIIIWMSLLVSGVQIVFFQIRLRCRFACIFLCFEGQLLISFWYVPLLSWEASTNWNVKIAGRIVWMSCFWSLYVDHRDFWVVSSPFVELLFDDAVLWFCRILEFWMNLPYGCWLPEDVSSPSFGTSCCLSFRSSGRSMEIVLWTLLSVLVGIPDSSCRSGILMSIESRPSLLRVEEVLSGFLRFSLRLSREASPASLSAAATFWVVCFRV